MTWPAFVDLLWNDKPGFWPDPSPASASSFFLKLLLKDSLYAVMEMRGPLPDPWNRAVALELGEHRHPGNAYYPPDAKAAVIAFKKAMKAPDKAPSAPPTNQPPPVGSPPATTKPEHLEASYAKR